jgi:hypothetical protein
MNHLFKLINEEKTKTKRKISLKLTAMEIFGKDEKCRDLLWSERMQNNKNNNNNNDTRQINICSGSQANLHVNNNNNNNNNGFLDIFNDQSSQIFENLTCFKLNDPASFDYYLNFLLNSRSCKRI